MRCSGDVHQLLLFTNKNVDLMIELIKSISGLIATYEIRLRSLPGCLDSRKTFLLSRNLFLTAWYIHRMRNKLKLFSLHSKQSWFKNNLSLFQTFHVRKAAKGVPQICTETVQFPSRSDTQVRLFCLIDYNYLIKNYDATLGLNETRKSVNWRWREKEQRSTYMLQS